jgi:hypothetical protein
MQYKGFLFKNLSVTQVTKGKGKSYIKLEAFTKWDRHADF